MSRRFAFHWRRRRRRCDAWRSVRREVLGGGSDVVVAVLIGIDGVGVSLGIDDVGMNVGWGL